MATSISANNELIIAFACRGSPMAAATANNGRASSARSTLSCGRTSSRVSSPGPDTGRATNSANCSVGPHSLQLELSPGALSRADDLEPSAQVEWRNARAGAQHNAGLGRPGFEWKLAQK